MLPPTEMVWVHLLTRAKSKFDHAASQEEIDVKEINDLEGGFSVSDVLLFRAVAERSLQAPSERSNGAAQETPSPPDAKYVHRLYLRPCLKCSVTHIQFNIILRRPLAWRPNEYE